MVASQIAIIGAKAADDSSHIKCQSSRITNVGRKQFRQESSQRTISKPIKAIPTHKNKVTELDCLNSEKENTKPNKAIAVVSINKHFSTINDLHRAETGIKKKNKTTALIKSL
jgi:hypothetical protein